MKVIPFNKPHFTGKELENIKQAVNNDYLAGNGEFTKKCQSFFQSNYGFNKCMLTTSCTDALEMVAILIDIKPDDEVIIPSYTFVSSANAFVLRGARIVFADSLPDHPNIDSSKIESLITKKTKAIVVVHYGGVACDMTHISTLAEKYNLKVIEDAAQSIDSFHKEDPLGSIGDLATFSFHETKNISSGEGGMLVINNPEYEKRAEIIWEKGTNRSAFYRGEVDKYNWVDIGSSFLPSDIIAACLYAQLEQLTQIQQKRKQLSERYNNQLLSLSETGKIQLLKTPTFATNNGHLFAIVCKTNEERNLLIKHLKSYNIHAVFHYLSLHKSPYYTKQHDGRKLENADRFSDCLVRLPMYYDLTLDEQDQIVSAIQIFYE